MSEDGNVVSLVPSAKETIPEVDYIITDVDGEEFYASGFLLFTSHHFAVMRDTGLGALPVLVLPLHRVRMAELVESDDEDGAPF